MCGGNKVKERANALAQYQQRNRKSSNDFSDIRDPTLRARMQASAQYLGNRSSGRSGRSSRTTRGRSGSKSKTSNKTKKTNKTNKTSKKVNRTPSKAKNNSSNRTKKTSKSNKTKNNSQNERRIKTNYMNKQSRAKYGGLLTGDRRKDNKYLKGKTTKPKTVRVNGSHMEVSTGTAGRGKNKQKFTKVDTGAETHILRGHHSAKKAGQIVSSRSADRRNQLMYL